MHGMNWPYPVAWFLLTWSWNFSRSVISPDLFRVVIFSDLFMVSDFYWPFSGQWFLLTLSWSVILTDLFLVSDFYWPLSLTVIFTDLFVVVDFFLPFHGGWFLLTWSWSMIFTDLFVVGDFYVGLLVSALWHKVSEYQWLLFDDVVKLDVKLRLHLGLHKVVEPLPVLVVDQTILEHAAAFVVPQLHHVVNALRKNK